MFRMGIQALSRLGSSLVPATGLPVAIDFGAGSLKVLQLGAGEPPSIAVAAALPTPPELIADPAGRLAWQLRELPGFMKQLPVRARRAICAIPSSQTFCKMIQVDPCPPTHSAAMVTSVVSGQLQCNPGALCCRHVVVRDPALAGGAGKQDVLALATSMQLVSQAMEGVKACRMELAGVFPEPMALIRAFDHISARADDAAITSLYLDIGVSGTRLVIAHGRELVFAKTISIGGRSLDQLVAKQGRYTMDEAHSARLALSSLTRQAPGRPAGRDGGGTGIPMLDAAVAASKTATRPDGAGPDGGPAIDRRGQAEVAAPAVPAGCLSLDSGQIDPDAPRIDLAEPLDALTEEIGLCLRYYEGLFPGRRVNRAIFVGGESRQLPLCQHVARALRLPASVADPLARFSRGGDKGPRGSGGGVVVPDSTVDGKPVSKTAPSAPGRGSAPFTLNVDLNQPQPGWALAVGLAMSPPDV